MPETKSKSSCAIMSKACLGQHMSNFKIISNNMEPVMKKPNIIEMKKPLAVGFAIFELSKLFMYQSYDKIRGHFEHDNLKLFFSDTDSFLFSVKCKNLNDELKLIQHMFDISKYKKTMNCSTTAEPTICFTSRMK